MFRSVLIDVDSTLSALEGIDWLATRRGPDVAVRVAEATDRAMRGEVALDAVYGERLSLVQPTRSDLAALAQAYADATVPNAARVIAEMQEAGVRVALVSGGIRQALIPFARTLGVEPADVHAVDVVLDMGGNYFAYDAGSPLATQSGKTIVAAELLRAGFARPMLALGDGATDLAMQGTVDAFAAFVGVVRREPIASAADHVIDTFDHLLELVLG